VYFTDEVIEIDINDCLRHDPWRFNGQVRTYAPISPAYIPITSTRQKYGYRLWFVCTHCNRRVGKMYAMWNYIACRQCLGLKYRVQYQKDIYTKHKLAKNKILRYEHQKRKMTYANKPTQFGRRYLNYKEQVEIF
jgi:hypothetical protein